MATHTLTVRVSGELKKFINQQTGSRGIYETPSEYIRDLIRHDLQSKEGWNWLKKELDPGMQAKESDFVTLSSEEIIKKAKAIKKRAR